MRPALPAQAFAPSVHKQTPPRLWISICAFMLVVCGAIGCFALAAGLFELALACVGPVLVSGLLLVLADELGCAS